MADFTSMLERIIPQRLHALLIPQDKQVLDTRNIYTTLEAMWMSRNQKMDEWNLTIRLDNYLWDKDMESFISNQPKTDFMLASQLLATASVPHRLDKSDIVTADEERAARDVERAIEFIWKRVSRHNRRSGKKTWMRNFSQSVLATGWYSVFVGMSSDAAAADIWAPNDVFPLWDDNLELVTVIHRQTLSGNRINTRLATMGLPLADVKATQDYLVLDHYKLDPTSGIILNGTIANTKVIKPWMPHQGPTDIPIIVGPVGGMPDRGTLPSSSGDRWTGHIGESIVEVNQNVQRSFNRHMSYLMQLTRDAANPRWVERTAGPPILNQNNLFKRGAIFRIGPNDSIEALDVPTIPIEITTSMRDVEDLLAKGGFPKAAFGTNNIQQSATATRAVIENSRHVLGPYIEELELVIADIDDIWAQFLYQGVRPYGLRFEVPFEGQSTEDAMTPDVVKESLFVTKVHPKIPGDLANRAAISRQLNPEFSLAESLITEWLYPEIPDPVRHSAQKRAEAALKHPAAVDLDLINALEAEADSLEELGDNERAGLYQSVADNIKGTLGQRQPDTSPAQQALPQGVAPQELGQEQV